METDSGKDQTVNNTSKHLNPSECPEEYTGYRLTLIIMGELLFLFIIAYKINL